MIGSVFVLIGSYSILLLGAAGGGLERLLFFVTAFLFSLFPTLLSTADTLSSGEGATVLQFLGASGRTITAAVLAAILGAGASGMIVGVVLGLVFSNFLGASSVGDVVGVLPNLAFLLASSTAGDFCRRRSRGWSFLEELELIPGLSRSAFGGAASTGTVTQLTHVSKVFLEPKRREVFTDVNMRVKRGEFVALAGPVGSGKTTLVNLLAGIERASSGSIQVLGKETTRLSGRELTTLRLASLGLVPQVQNLMQEFTVSQNVELPLFFLGEGERESRLSRVQEVLALMGISADAERKVADLSVGEKQLVSIARAMVKDPPLLVMDEPTESLDPLVSELILEMLRGDNALRAKTLIIATHDKRIIELATRTVRMSAKIQA